MVRPEKCKHKKQTLLGLLLVEMDEGKFTEYHFICEKCHIITTNRAKKPVKNIEKIW